MNRKYVINSDPSSLECYVSSSGHWHLDLRINHQRYSYSLDYGELRQIRREGEAPLWKNPPQDLLQQIRLLVLEALKSGSIRFYEYNQLGERRYEQLRYYEPEQAESYISKLEDEEDIAPEWNEDPHYIPEWEEDV